MPKVKERWIMLVLILAIFIYRIYCLECKFTCQENKRHFNTFFIAYAVVTYLLGLWYLNQIMLYLSPLEDPEDQLDQDLEGRDFVFTKKQESDEYKGFERKILEFELW